MRAALGLLGVLSIALAGVASGATAPMTEPFDESSLGAPRHAQDDARDRVSDEVDWSAFAPQSATTFLFDSGAPVTNPYGVCGGCYAWSSTFYASPVNFDLTARKFSVPAGSFVSAIRMWWAYGDDGPHPNSANLGGSAGDFSSISVDLYAADGPGGSPGTLLTNLTGTWTLLDAPTHYRELSLDAPYVFSGTDYYVSLRAETAGIDYQATVLWAMCASSDPHIDYENYLTVNGSTAGWAGYPTLGPCPADQDFGLQILGAFAPDEVDVLADPGCITPADPCKTLTFDFNRADATPMRGFSVTFQLTGLELCAGVSSIVEGPYLSSYCGGGCTVMQVIDNGGGSYTVDCAILGATCGPTGTGTLFTADVQSAGSDGTGTATVIGVLARDCGNIPIPAAPGAGATLTIDSVGPVAIADLSATPVLSGNDTDGTTAITLDFTAPGDADVIEVYRAPFGKIPSPVNAYPEYDDVVGAGPPTAPTYPPSTPWASTAITASGQSDDPGTRGYWYYVVFTKDECGNVSGVSNLSVGHLDYHLGDVTDGTTPGNGDNEVGVDDISLLGANYGISLVPSDPLGYLDVGPTSDGSTLGLPQTDNEVDFEDLILFAINFGQVSARRDLRPPTTSQARLALEAQEADGELEAVVSLAGNADHVQGVHARIPVPRGFVLARSTEGDLWGEQSGPVFVKIYQDDRTIVVDGAALGTGHVIAGNGVVVRLVLSQSEATLGAADTPDLRLTDVALRDVENREVGPQRARWNDLRGAGASLEAGPVPAASEIGASALSVEPNPFGSSTRIVYRAPQETRVEAAIFDVRGHRVRTWEARTIPAGSTVWSWDGRGDGGENVPAGVYLLRLETGEGTMVRKLFRIHRP
ncbi:MAG: FlgD immunoglobulin-like domain containing protein [Candidatus Eisenbacteria bacterium]